MEKFCVYVCETVMLFISILALSFLFSFFFAWLPSGWISLVFFPLLIAACADIYNLFEKLHLYIPIVINSALLLIFTVLSFLFFDLPTILKVILCLETAGAVAYSIYIRKKLKNTYSGSFPIAYKRNCDIVYNSCAAFIMALGGDHSDRILSSFIAFIEDDFEPFPEFSSRHADLNSLMLRTLDHVLIQLASEPRFYHSRSDNDEWHKSNDTLIGKLLEIYQKVQYLYEKDFIEACRKWAVLVELINNKYKDNPPPLLTAEESVDKRIREPEENLFSQMSCQS